MYISKKVRFEIYKYLQLILTVRLSPNPPTSITGSIIIRINNRVYYFSRTLGFCSHLARLSEVIGYKYGSLEPFEFPELMEYAPSDENIVFWGDDKWRLDVINQILEKEEQAKLKRKHKI